MLPFACNGNWLSTKSNAITANQSFNLSKKIQKLFFFLASQEIVDALLKKGLDWKDELINAVRRGRVSS